jgi:hypothetical protein
LTSTNNLHQTVQVLAELAEHATREAVARVIVGTAPGATAVEAIRAARSVELAAHAEVLGHIRQAREAGDSWAAVGEMFLAGNASGDVSPAAPCCWRSALTVEPAASLCAVPSRRASLVILNRDPTPYDRAATVVIGDPIGQAVHRIASPLASLGASQACFDNFGQ